MGHEMFIQLLSSFLFLLIGLMAKFSNNDGWSGVKRYWLFFIVIGSITLIYNAYKLI